MQLSSRFCLSTPSFSTRLSPNAFSMPSPSFPGPAHSDPFRLPFTSPSLLALCHSVLSFHASFLQSRSLRLFFSPTHRKAQGIEERVRHCSDRHIYSCTLTPARQERSVQLDSALAQLGQRCLPLHKNDPSSAEEGRMTRSKTGNAPRPKKRRDSAGLEVPRFTMEEIQKWNTYLNAVRQTGPHWAKQ